MKIKLTLLVLLTTVLGFGQTLKTATVTMQPDSNCYLSIKNLKAYTEKDAMIIKSALDLALVLVTDETYKILEWYDLKKDNENEAEELTATTGINAISFYSEQFDKCKTLSDPDTITELISVKTRHSFYPLFINTGRSIDR